jgi:hypothetical protein
VLAARILDQDTAHDLGCGRVEVAAVVPRRRATPLFRLDEPQVGLVNQGRGFQSLVRLLLGELLRRQFAQLVVDEGQQLLRGVRVARFDAGEDLRNFVHGRHPRTCKSRRNVPALFRQQVRQFWTSVRVEPDEPSGPFLSDGDCP